MPIQVKRKNVLFVPDKSRVIARFLYTTRERSRDLISRIMTIPERKQQDIFTNVLNNFSRRHRSITRIFNTHFNRLSDLLAEMNIDPDTLNAIQKALMGAYFTMEYSIEAAAFFNPSMVEAPDQSELNEGEKRVIISFRATGEGHISSVVFRSGVIDHNNDIIIDTPGKMLESPEHIKNHIYHKKSFNRKLNEMRRRASTAYDVVMKKLTDNFTYDELKRYVIETRELVPEDREALTLLDGMMWLASSHYNMDFSVDTDIAERVIFPIADTEIKGIEDARFVRFTEDDGEIIYYATYTAYDGISILPKMLLTRDFYHFEVMPLHGEVAQNKGMALFPRKINGRYAMLCRTDGVNNYIAYSENISLWRKAVILQRPEYEWELVQIGNCGSPIETPDGWLVITHGVGPMRKYVLGVSLLDLNDASKVIGRLPYPLIMPNEKEREGYVPNVVYSCGSMIHNEDLIIPYAMSDYASTYATVNLNALLAALKASGVASKG